MAIIQDWKIRSRSHACAHTGNAFEEGDVFYTASFPDEESGGLARRDYSDESWESLRDELQPG